MNLPLAFTYPTETFNVKDTLECGQLFRYQQLSQTVYAVFSQDKYCQIEQGEKDVFVYTDDKDYFWNFFDCDTNYLQKVERISAISPLMHQVSTHGKGIRILNQNLTEMIFCFIISANNNIKRIQLIVQRLCEALGEKTPYGYAFPTVEKLASQTVDFYASIGAGYRDKYLLATAQKLLTYDFNNLLSMDTDTARKELLTFIGIGPKVADCILLFGMKHGDVFPVDTWLKKVYHQYFEQGHADNQISAFFCQLFGEDAGLCQQYLFYFQRKV